jgi:serine/threonine protein kinase
LINLRHPCIVGPIGFVFGLESGSRQELKIVRLYLEGLSLAEVFCVRPVWWTSTLKAKVVAGIVLGLQFAHSLGLVHGSLTAHNILFDSDHYIHIVDFKPIGLEVGNSEIDIDIDMDSDSAIEIESQEKTHLGDFSVERWTPEKDIEAFASILFEIVVGRPAQGEISVPAHIPAFVSNIIDSGLWLKSARPCSLVDIFQILKQNDFRIEDGVDTAEVSAFANWVEAEEYPEK